MFKSNVNIINLISRVLTNLTLNLQEVFFKNEFFLIWKLQECAIPSSTNTFVGRWVNVTPTCSRLHLRRRRWPRRIHPAIRQPKARHWPPLSMSPVCQVTKVDVFIDFRPHLRQMQMRSYRVVNQHLHWQIYWTPPSFFLKISCINRLC